MRYLVLLLMACDSDVRGLPDGGEEYRLPDGGWVTNGTPCGCSNVGLGVFIDDDKRSVLDCVPVTQCNRDGCEVSVCYGAGCCVWTAP